MILRKWKLTTVLVLFLLLLLFNSCTKIEKNITENDKNIKENENIIKKVENEDENNIKEEVIKENTNVSILAVGDVMFHNTQVYAAYNKEQNVYDFNNTFQYVKKYINEADLAIANFETVTAGKEHGFKGYPTFNSPIETIEALKNAGFDIINTANNHSLDKGKEGVIETIDNIKEYGLLHLGTSKEKNDDIFLKNINDINIAFLSYTYSCNGNEPKLTTEELSFMINIIDEEKIKEDIIKAEVEADVVVVYIHWGNEYQRVPSDYQVDLSNKMIEWGADIIFGGHPHVIQKSEIVKHNGEDKFIIYSLGNFVSDQRRETLKKIRNSKYTEDGVMVKIHIEKDFKLNKAFIKNVEYIPTWVNKYKINGRNNYEILPVSDFLNEMKLKSQILNKLEESYRNTMDLMYNKNIE